MSLWFDLRINDRVYLGRVVVRRLEPLAVALSAAGDEIHPYEVKRDGVLLGEVEHRYGDGPWVLASKALELVVGEGGTLVARLRCGMRPGRKVPVTIYIQMGEEPADSDPAVCTVPYPLLAQLLCDGVNAQPNVQEVLALMGADLVARQAAFPVDYPVG